MANPGGGVRFVIELIKAFYQTAPEIEFEIVSHGAAWHRYQRLFAENGLNCKLLRVPPANSPRLERKWWHSVPGNALALRLIGRRIPWTVNVKPIATKECDLVWYPWLHRHLHPFESATPVVATFHDTIALEFPGLLSESHVSSERSSTAEWLRSPAGIAVSSETTAECLMRLFGTSRDRLSIIRLTGAHSLNADNGGELPSGWTWTKSPFLLCPANTSPHKNHETLLRAVAKWGSEIPIVLVGFGTDWHTDKGPHDVRKAALRKLDESLQLSAKGKLQSIGYVDDKTYYALLNRAWAVVMPTLAEGGGSFPIAEAVSRGIPVVCSDIPILREQFSIQGGSPIWFSALSEDDLATSLRSLELDYRHHKSKTVEQVGQIIVQPWSEVATNYLHLFHTHVRY